MMFSLGLDIFPFQLHVSGLAQARLEVASSSLDKQMYL